MPLKQFLQKDRNIVDKRQTLSQIIVACLRITKQIAVAAYIRLLLNEDDHELGSLKLCWHAVWDFKDWKHFWSCLIYEIEYQNI